MFARTRQYNIWVGLKQRCNNSNSDSFKNYWWRWISYDPKRESFKWFREDMKEWCSDNLTIDRINNNLDYCKNNCKRSTHKQQANNTARNRIVNYKWLEGTLAIVCKRLNVDYWLIQRRLSRWWNIEKAIECKKLVNQYC